MAEIDVNQIRVFGPGLTNGHTGKKCLIYISGASGCELEHGHGHGHEHGHGLSFSINGPNCKSDVVIDYANLNEDGNVEAYFVPLVSGEYEIAVTFKEKPVNGSPFKAKVTGKAIDVKKLLSKVRVIGKCSSIGRALVINEFLVDCSRVKPVIGGLTVHVKGPIRSSAHLDIIDNKNGTYQVLYKPILSGTYNMDIKIADFHIPGSPLKIRVMDRSNSVF